MSILYILSIDMQLRQRKVEKIQAVGTQRIYLSIKELRIL